MASAPQNYDWSIIYRTIGRYISIQYHRGITWILNQGNYAYSKLPVIQVLFSQRVQSGWGESKNFLWRHKIWVIGSAAAVVAWWIIQYIRSKIPQYPIVKMESTLNVAELRIEIPPELREPINVTLTFCVDTSGSMKEQGRIDAVKKALDDVLTNAQIVVNQSDGAKMKIAMVGFDEVARVILPVTEVTKGGNMQTALDQVKSLKCNGGTSILAGLGQTIAPLQTMAKADKQASHTVVLLTDGDSTIDSAKLLSIHKVLTSVSAKLFAIGIGEDHKEKTLKQIASYGGFKGTYIDTKKANPTIEKAIGAIYEQAISSFQEMSLSTAQIKAGLWSVGGAQSVLKEGRSVCDLLPLSAGKARQTYITIHVEKLSSQLDLSTVEFKLAFTDTKGRYGSLSLPWNPTPIVQPRILTSAKA